MLGIFILIYPAWITSEWVFNIDFFVYIKHAYWHSVLGQIMLLSSANEVSICTIIFHLYLPRNPGSQHNCNTMQLKKSEDLFFSKQLKTVLLRYNCTKHSGPQASHQETLSNSPASIHCLICIGQRFINPQALKAQALKKDNGFQDREEWSPEMVKISSCTALSHWDLAHLVPISPRLQHNNLSCGHPHLCTSCQNWRWRSSAM